jgi:hypothetical protein
MPDAALFQRVFHPPHAAHGAGLGRYGGFDQWNERPTRLNVRNDPFLEVTPEGLVVGVPKRGGLLFVPASDIAAVNNFRRAIAPLFTTSENMRVSSALYLFNDKGWSVFQDPLPTQ